MSNNKKPNNVEVVLAPGGSATAPVINDPKTYKQNLKDLLNTLKQQQKSITKQISATQKELSKSSVKKSTTAPTTTTTNKKEVKIVSKKGKQNKLAGKK